MAVTVTDHALLTVKTTHVTYKLEIVLHVNLDGQENIVKRVCSIINLCLKFIENISEEYLFQSCFKILNCYRTLLEYVQNNDHLLDDSFMF